MANAKQIATAANLYLGDNNETYPIARYSAGANSDPTLAYPDKVVGQLLLPYLKSIQVLSSPADSATESERETVDMPVVPSKVSYSDVQRKFALAYKSDYGYNSATFSRGGINCNRPGAPYRANSSRHSQVTNPSQTVLMVNSIWGRTPNGKPYGGGTYLVDPPCFVYEDGSLAVLPKPLGCKNSVWAGGWTPSSPLSTAVFGGVWPWHASGATTVWADGHVTVERLARLSVGCNVRDGSRGVVADKAKYLWDLN